MFKNMINDQLHEKNQRNISLNEHTFFPLGKIGKASLFLKANGKMLWWQGEIKRYSP